DGDIRGEGDPYTQTMIAEREAELVAGFAAIDGEGEERGVRHEGVAGPDRVEPAAMVEGASRFGVDTHKARRPAQLCKVGKRIGAGGGGNAEATVQQLVPHVGRDQRI